MLWAELKTRDFDRLIVKTRRLLEEGEAVPSRSPQAMKVTEVDSSTSLRASARPSWTDLPLAARPRDHERRRVAKARTIDKH